jgi:hypothetical protein
MYYLLFLTFKNISDIPVLSHPWPGIIKLFPAQESLVSDSRLGTRKSLTFFNSVMLVCRQRSFDQTYLSSLDEQQLFMPIIEEQLRTGIQTIFFTSATITGMEGHFQKKFTLTDALITLIKQSAVSPNPPSCSCCEGR